MMKQDVLVQCPVLCVMADNPRASEFEHPLGHSAKKFCRRCMVCTVHLLLQNIFKRNFCALVAWKQSTVLTQAMLL